MGAIVSSDNNTPGMIASEFQTISRLVQIATPGFQKVADRNPNRVYIQFWVDQAVQSSILPEPGQNVSLTFTTIQANPLEYTLRDAPSLVTGEWYAFIGGGIGNMYVNECVYIR